MHLTGADVLGDLGLAHLLEEAEVQDHPAAAGQRLATLAEQEGFAVHWGRKVLEVRPPVRLDKGLGVATLLRLMSGIYEPTRGRASIKGKVAPVFDLAVGMDPEISGLENILIRGLFLGMTRKQMEARVDDIAAFTELGDYLSMPLRTYSTGMRVRLALGVVTSIDPECTGPSTT